MKLKIKIPLSALDTLLDVISILLLGLFILMMLSKH